MTENLELKIGLDVQATGEEVVSQLTASISKLETKLKSITALARQAASGAVSSSNSGKGSSTGSTSSRPDRDAAAVARAIKAEAREKERALRQRFAFQERMRTQRRREESQVVAAIGREQRAKESALRRQFDVVGRLARQRAKEEAQAARDVERNRSNREKAFTKEQAFIARMARQRASEERATSRDAARSIRENARVQASEDRRHDRERQDREASRSRGLGNIRQGAGDVREGVGRAVRGAGAMSAVATAGAGLAIRRGISTRMETDTAETNLRIFSGQSRESIKAARSGWLDNESIKNGLSVASGIEAYGEVLKAGLKGPVENTKSIMAATSALELDLKQTTKLAGLIDRNYGASSTPAKLKSALNAIAVAAREDPTQAPEIVEGMKRGFGVLSMGNMSPEDLAAFVSGGQSVGIQPGKAGTFIATLGKQLSSGSNKFLGKKETQELNFAASKLGFGNAKSMAKEFQFDSTGTIFRVLEGLKAADAQTRTTIAGALSGNQWSDEDLQIVNGLDGLKSTYSAIHDKKNANFLDEASAQKNASLQGEWNSTQSIFGRFWSAFGGGFEDILDSINDYFLRLNSKFDYDKITSYVTSFMDGIEDALGVKTWKELLQNIFGGDLGNLGPKIRDFAKGLTEGVSAIAGAIRSVATVFSVLTHRRQSLANGLDRSLRSRRPSSSVALRSPSSQGLAWLWPVSPQPRLVRGGS
ncbi:phage tail tape measure protein [Methylobacterium sp. J-059]|uniref:phage tail tape measure protein n=1 Tax=Methylobacterium sp. J-059 TaxID=2836643 RepID=UPI001FB8F4D9|nr:phage tail tape measure protein [Methylobacterium sp. J-059]MCJ2039519.1 phage tail tape measure protein [Methylobacterium sp. J-059]